MAALPGECHLGGSGPNRIRALPGTHNSACYQPSSWMRLSTIGWPWAKCQSVTLEDQLRMGFRCFDLRLTDDAGGDATAKCTADDATAATGTDSAATSSAATSSAATRCAATCSAINATSGAATDPTTAGDTGASHSTATASAAASVAAVTSAVTATTSATASDNAIATTAALSGTAAPSDTDTPPPPSRILVTHTFASSYTFRQALQSFTAFLRECPSELVVVIIKRDWHHRKSWRERSSARVWEIAQEEGIVAPAAAAGRDSAALLEIPLDDLRGHVLLVCDDEALAPGAASSPPGGPPGLGPHIPGTHGLGPAFDLRFHVVDCWECGSLGKAQKALDMYVGSSAAGCGKGLLPRIGTNVVCGIQTPAYTAKRMNAWLRSRLQAEWMDGRHYFGLVSVDHGDEGVARDIIRLNAPLFVDRDRGGSGDRDTAVAEGKSGSARKEKGVDRLSWEDAAEGKSESNS